MGRRARQKLHERSCSRRIRRVGDDGGGVDDGRVIFAGDGDGGDADAFFDTGIRGEDDARVGVAIGDVGKRLADVAAAHDARLESGPEAAFGQGFLRVDAGRDGGGVRNREAVDRRQAAPVAEGFAVGGGDQDQTVAGESDARRRFDLACGLQGVHFLRRRGREDIDRRSLLDLFLQETRRAKVEADDGFGVRGGVGFANRGQGVGQRRGGGDENFIRLRGTSEKQGEDDRCNERRGAASRRFWHLLSLSVGDLTAIHDDDSREAVDPAGGFHVVGDDQFGGRGLASQRLAVLVQRDPDAFVADVGQQFGVTEIDRVAVMPLDRNDELQFAMLDVRVDPGRGGFQQRQQRNRSLRRVLDALERVRNRLDVARELCG